MRRIEREVLTPASSVRASSRNGTSFGRPRSVAPSSRSAPASRSRFSRRPLVGDIEIDRSDTRSRAPRRRARRRATKSTFVPDECLTSNGSRTQQSALQRAPATKLATKRDVVESTRCAMVAVEIACWMSDSRARSRSASPRARAPRRAGRAGARGSRPRARRRRARSARSRPGSSAREPPAASASRDADVGASLRSSPGVMLAIYLI